MPTSIDQPTVCACDSSAHLYPLCIYAMPPSLHSAVVRTRNTPNHLPHSHAHVIRTEEASVCLSVCVCRVPVSRCVSGRGAIGCSAHPSTHRPGKLATSPTRRHARRQTGRETTGGLDEHKHHCLSVRRGKRKARERGEMGQTDHTRQPASHPAGQPFTLPLVRQHHTHTCTQIDAHLNPHAT